MIDAQLWKEELRNESAAHDQQRQVALQHSLLDLAREVSAEAAKLVLQSDRSLQEMAVNLAPILTQYAVLIQVLHSQVRHVAPKHASCHVWVWCVQRGSLDTLLAVVIQVMRSQAAGHIPMLASGSGATFPHHKGAQFLDIREPGSEVRDPFQRTTTRWACARCVSCDR